MFVSECLAAGRKDALRIWKTAVISSAGMLVHGELSCVALPDESRRFFDRSGGAVFALKCCCAENLRVLRRCAAILRFYRQGQVCVDAKRAKALLKLMHRAGLWALGAYVLLEKGRVCGRRGEVFRSSGVLGWFELFTGKDIKQKEF